MMKKITEIDKNFAASSVCGKEMKLYDAEKEPFKIYGVYKPDKKRGFVRMDPVVANAVNDGVGSLNYHTAGGRVRFKTNSRHIAVKCSFADCWIMPHMPASGSAGFDMYSCGKYLGSFIPPNTCTASEIPDNIKSGYEAAVDLKDEKMRDIIINFPLYNDVLKLYIGIDENAVLEEGDKYPNEKPIVFYGSSITQGGCASRPGNSYQSILSRRLNFDFLNLGFSGSARAEEAMSDYIAGLEMSAFVYDYDHNAPSAEHLKNTHYKMYKKIRAAHPDIPIITAPAPSPCFEDAQERAEIIRQTSERAKSEGDNNIYFIDGIFKSHDSEMMTVDGCHPNDFGMYCMAEAFEKVLKEVMTNENK